MERRYNIENEEEIIQEIQRYLLAVTPGEENNGITIHGSYDAVTENGVRAFQRREGLEENGIVDFVTWTLLYERYLETQEGLVTPCIPDPVLFDFQLGDSGYHIILLQTLLGEFSSIYPNVIRPAITGQFGLTTADAVRALQRNYGRYADGIVTQTLWSFMIRDYFSKKMLRQYSHIF